MSDATKEGFYYNYGIYSTRERAEAAMDESFATGEISACERPRIKEDRGCYILQLFAYENA